MAFISNGTTIFDAGAVSSSFKGAMTFISKTTASSDANVGITSGIDSTYKEYIFIFKNIHPATDSVVFQTNFSIDGGSNYNVTKTTTNYEATMSESGTTGFKYGTGDDLAQGTGYQRTGLVGNDNDENVNGFLHLYNPSSTTFVKHFVARTHGYYAGSYSWSNFMAGYCNTTSAVNAVNFQMSSGNIDSGDILLYGIN